MTELTPKRSSFIFARVSGAIIVSTVLSGTLMIIALAAESILPAALGVLIWFALVGLSAWSALVAFSKERYEIHAGHLVAHAGGIVSDQTTELDARNITHIKQHLPWIRYRFFNVGDVIVQSAGSAGAEVVFRSVADPDAVYDQLRTLLKGNGFSMQAGELLHSEQPSTVGAIVECVSLGAGAAFFMLWMSTGLMTGGAALGPIGMIAGGLAAVLLAAGAFAFLGLHFMDMKQRTYEVYDDIVEYREGFLSRTNAFIPYENIADASTRQTFIDQILGLYDVRVSCQGSGSEVAFRRLAGGPQLQEILRGRVDAAQEVSRQEKETVRKAASAASAATPDDAAPSAAAAASRRPPARAVPADEAWTATFKMNTPRALLGGALIRALGTTYTVGGSSIASRFSFLGQQQLEFAYDKLTGVQVRTSPLDGLMGTLSVRIWSIGSSTPLDLAHVDRAAVDLPALLRQAGIPGGEARHSLPAAFGPLVWLRAHAVGLVFIGLMSAACLLAAILVTWELILLAVLLVGLLASSLPLSAARARFQSLTLHDHHMEHKAGIFWKKHTYARYDDMKKMSVVRYVGGTHGRLTVFVAGETQIQTKNGQAGAVVPNTFVAHYLPDVAPLQHTLDALLLGRIEPDAIGDATKAAAPQGPEFKPAVPNAVVPLIGFGIILFPLWFFVPYAALAAMRRRYRVEDDRVVIEDGVIHRAHTSVLFDRIDSLKQGQGMLGKAFGNGTVTLLTAGSSRPDLVLSNTAGYQELYGAIRERYGG